MTAMAQHLRLELAERLIVMEAGDEKTSPHSLVLRTVVLGVSR